MNVAVRRVLRCWSSGSKGDSNRVEERDFDDVPDDVGWKNGGQVSQVKVRVRSVRSRLEANKATRPSSRAWGRSSRQTSVYNRTRPGDKNSLHVLTTWARSDLERWEKTRAMVSEGIDKREKDGVGVRV